MTRRERMERRAERRREWAESRQSKANTAFRVGDEHRDEHGRMDWALVTQPGHIPERARINRAHERGHEHAKMADHHEAKAAGIEHQLERSIFSDDPDATEALEAKALAIEAEADRAKAVNAAHRKAPGDTPEAKLLNLAHDVPPGLLVPPLTNEEARGVLELWRLCPYHKPKPFPSYHLTNLRANARRARERIKEVQKRAELDAAAAAAPGGVLILRHPEVDWCTVAFAEKPEREIINTLKAAGFWWTSGRWGGKLSALPPAVEALSQ